MDENQPNVEASASSPASVAPKAPATACAMCRAPIPLASAIAIEKSARLCPSCDAKSRAFPLPPWVRGFYLVTFALVASGFLFNARFIVGYAEVKMAAAALSHGDLAKATRLWHDIAGHVPENRDVATTAHLYDGLTALTDERNDEAIRILEEVEKDLPNNPNTQSLLRRARISSAFEHHDWDGMVELSKRSAEHEHTRLSELQLASAYACRFATSQAPEDKAEALAHLHEGQALPPSPADGADEFEQRILHRLATHEIITANEFHKRFPNGWRE